MSDPAATPLIVSVPPKFANCTCPAMSAAADGDPPSMSERSTSRPCLAKIPISLATKGARFAGDTLPYEALILIGSAEGVGAPAATDGLGAVVAPPPHAATTSATSVNGTNARETLCISRHLRAAAISHQTRMPAAAAKVIPFDRFPRSLKTG